MVYLHYFENQGAFELVYNGSDYIEPWVSYTEGKGVDYNKPYDPYLHMPFTIEALGSGNITWALGAKTVQYSKNGGSWETMTSATTIQVIEGDEVQFKGTNETYSDAYSVMNNISTTAQFNVKGNIMSLTNGDNFENVDTIAGGCFMGLFYRCTLLISSKNLKLPATTLMYRCYMRMFQGCIGLTAAPELPAMTMVSECYSNMFNGCTSLTTAPELPATTLFAYCYTKMFYGCTSLTTAPELPATTLPEECYDSMFQGCTSLTTAPELPATTLTYYCYHQMFSGCTNLNYIKAMFTTTPSTTYTSNWVNGVASTGTFVKNAAATWTTTGVYGIPTGWTVETATE